MLANADVSSLPYALVREYLLQADKRTVLRALPRQVAGALDLEPRLTLELLVAAMFGGDAVLHWEIVCPACGARGEQHDWLRHASHVATCESCKATFNVRLDDEAQVTFSPHPTLRTLGPDADDPDFRRTLYEQSQPTTVHELLTIQSFRDWAREQPLPEGEHLEVSRVVIWFSDLAGSTALYERTGDPLGYELVRDHFDLVFESIHRSGGAVVKTTGDGVMAVFTTGESALGAALDAHRALGELNSSRELSEDRQLSLKVGVHAGPAIAVTLNERLDYFGTSVNIASRIGDLAYGGETVFTDAVLAEPGAQAIAETHTVESLQTPIRGLSRSLTAYRMSGT